MNQDRIAALLKNIYGPDTGGETARQLNALLDNYKGKIPPPWESSRWSERDALLITYADPVQDTEKSPLASLRGFAADHLGGVVSGIHILPFYPWSSDDGFSVVDYEAVAPEYGTWEDVRRLGQDYRLMFDAVINHA